MADDESIGRTRLSAMVDSTKADWETIVRADAAYAQKLPDWLLDHLTLLQDDCHGFAIDRFQHSLQSATRAYCDGRDEEYVTCALMHDVGSALAPQDHAAFAAMILQPFVSEQNHWMLQHHSTFQGYYYFHHFGLDRNMRDQLRGHPHFEYTAQFCHLYDQVAFDPAYDNMPLEAFAPMVHRTLAVRKR